MIVRQVDEHTTPRTSSRGEVVAGNAFEETSVAIDMAKPSPRANGAGAPERRASAIPTLLVLLVLTAGVGYSVLRALDQRRPDPQLPPPTIIFLGAASSASPSPSTSTLTTSTSTTASPAELASGASTATPAPTAPTAPHPPTIVAKKTAPVPPHVVFHPHPLPPAPTTDATNIVELPAPPPAASDIPLSPPKAMPVTMK
jgi:hypothetical protein